MSDTYDALLQASARYPILRHDRQLELAYRVRAWLDWPASAGPCPPAIAAKGERAKQRLMLTNIKLVAAQVNRFRHLWNQQPDRRADLLQEGCFGLSRGIEKFDPTRGYALSTYCVPWIRQAIGRSAPGIDMIRLPENIHSDRSKLARLAAAYAAGQGHQAPMEWLSQQSGLTPQRITDLLSYGDLKTASLDQAARGADGDGLSIVDLIADTSGESPTEALEVELRHKQLHDAIPRLLEAERTVLLLVDFQGLSHAEAGHRLGVGRSRVSQLRQQALERLRPLLRDLEPPSPQAGAALPCIVCGARFVPSRASSVACSLACRRQRNQEISRRHRVAASAAA